VTKSAEVTSLPLRRCGFIRGAPQVESGNPPVTWGGWHGADGNGRRAPVWRTTGLSKGPEEAALVAPEQTSGSEAARVEGGRPVR